MPGRRVRRFLTGIGVVALLVAAAWLTVEPHGPAGRLRERLPEAIARAAGLAEGARPSGAAAPGVGEPGWVAAENRRPGTAAWHITRRGPSHAIEGYADRVSASAGDAVTVYVSTTARWLHVEAYRMGWYGGARGWLLWRSGRVGGRRQADPSLWPGTNMVQARWVPSLTFRVGDRWPPGAYLLKLVAPGAQRYVPLTVTDLHQHPELLLRHRALLSLGHDEYWSSSMRHRPTVARDHGVTLALLVSNA